MKTILSYIFLILFTYTRSQETNMDSLLETTKFLKEDTIKVNSINRYLKNSANDKQVLEYTTIALKLAEKLNYKTGIATCYENLGSVYASQGDIDKAFDYLQKALTIYRETHNAIGIATELNNISAIYFKKKKYIESEKMLTESLNLFIDLNDEEGVSECYRKLGNLYLEKNDDNNAKLYFAKALTLFEKNKYYTGIALINTSLAELYLRKNDLSMAEKHALVSLNTAVQHKLFKRIVDATELLDRVYLAGNNFKKAYDMNKLNRSYSDSINQGEIKNLTQKYEYDRKDEERKVIQKEKDAIAFEKLKQQKQQRNYFIAGFVLMIIFSLFIYRGYKQKAESNKIISLQKHLVDEKQKEILDSINYAKRIQYTLLAHTDFLEENIPHHFIYFNPKDIVSGDFYWAAKKGDKFYLAVCDSTGHGVPGAFMSLLNIGFLSEAINEKGIEKPNEVFNFVRQRLIDNISKEGQKDGFDGILICMDQKTKQITYSAANNNPILIQNNQIIELEADRMPVGMGERKEDFKLYHIDLKSGDTLYLYTDGYADQFGGPKGKKFKYKTLNELILANSTTPLEEQHKVLKSSFEAWRGELEQVDDVCIIGIRL